MAVAVSAINAAAINHEVDPVEPNNNKDLETAETAQYFGGILGGLARQFGQGFGGGLPNGYGAYGGQQQYGGYDQGFGGGLPNGYGAYGGQGGQQGFGQQGFGQQEYGQQGFGQQGFDQQQQQGYGGQDGYGQQGIGQDGGLAQSQDSGINGYGRR